MEMNRTELAAVDGVACDLLDTQGRLVVTPNALTLDGQRNMPADLRPGETLEVFLGRHVPGIESGAWTVMIGGATVPRKMWSRTWPKHGQLIACRASVGKQVVAIVAIAVLSYFTMGAGATLGGSLLGINGLAMVGSAGLAAVNMGIFIAGSALINKVLGPKVPKPGETVAARQIYSLSGQRNSPRPYEPLPVLWGEMRVTPDLASQPYTWFEGDDQYLSTILLGGVNVHSAADLAIGDTAATSYSDMDVFYNGFSGMGSQDVPLYGNADAIAGAELEPNGSWITRTSSAGAMALQLDIEGQLFDTDNKGATKTNSVPLLVETRLVGASVWQSALSITLTNASTEVLRRTYTLPVVLGQHEVRVRLGQPTYNEGDGKDACKLAWNVLKSIQPDATDYSAWGRIGIKIKATGQLSGGLDTLRVTYRARPIPVWNGAAWVMATTREEGLSNPGAILLQALRGVYADGVLQFGFGMQDEQIDIEGLKAFMLHCTARGYRYDRWITGQMSLGTFCQEVALAGMGEFSWTDGSRPTAVFVGSGQPLSGVVNMANMLKGSFSVAYSLSNAADGIEYQYLDRNRNWETQTLRVAAPGVTTMLNPARVTGEGVTTEAHAAVLARYHLAQSLYQYKTIDFGADIEHLAYRRLSVLSISHDLTQWGFGGRVMRAERVAGKVVLQLDEPVPPLAQAWVGLRVPGARDYRVFKVQALAAESDQITLVEAWPAGVKFPGEDLDNPAHDTLWCYDFKATPGYRVRVVGMAPEADLKGAKVSCVPEGPEFWDYVLNGSYTPPPNQSSLPQLGRPSVSNLRISEQVNVQGDTEWYELHAVWDAEGDYDHAQVWAGRDGSELRLVDGNAVGSRCTFRIDAAGEWLVEVRPFNASGLVGQSATVLYITTMTQLPPRNVNDFVVQEVAGGMRRFAWQYSGDRPPAFAGVQIRYLPGDVVLSVANWGGMQPLGHADDVYRAQFETTRPQAGQWTFGCRAIDTAGQLANGVVRYVTSLGDSFEEVQQPDLTPPPAPGNVVATPFMTTAQVNWDVPLYEQGHGHDHSVLYLASAKAGVPDPVFAAAVSVATPSAAPASIPVEVGTTYMLWVTHVSRDDVEGPPSAPVKFTTAEDIAKLLEILAGKVGEAQFTPIVLGQLGKIGDLTITVDGLEQQLSDLVGAAAYAPATAYASGTLVQLDGKIYRASVNVPAGNPPPNAAFWTLVGDYASIGEAVIAHSVQLQELQLEVDELGNVVGANATTVEALQAAARSDGDDADGFLADVVNGWHARASIIEERQVRAAADKSEATARLQLAAAVGDNHAAVEQQFSAQAGINGYLAAKYSLSVQVGQGDQAVVGGMQITGSSEGGEGPKIAIAFATDAFSIASPDGAREAIPFYVQTSPQTINGVVVPAGVYMDAAYINNVTALWGRFGNLVADTIQATEISASQLTAGNGVIGGTLKSANFVAGSSGWRLMPDGVAEFSGVIVRGTIHAFAGTIGTFSISSNGLNSGGYTGYAWPPGTATGVHVSQAGILIGNPSTGRYLELKGNGDISGPQFSIVGGVAKFSGQLSAASGTFSGSLTAQAINAVSTINIAGNAVTVPAAHSGSGYSAAVTITLDFAAPVLVIASFFGQQIAWFTPVVRRNGNEIIRGNGFSSGGVNPTIPVTITGVDYPGVGTHTYTVANVGDGESSSTTISVIGAKR